MKYIIRINIFLLSAGYAFSSYSADREPPSYYGKTQYEVCDCTNNKFTKHITEPYKKEIEEMAPSDGSSGGSGNGSRHHLSGLQNTSTCYDSGRRRHIQLH